VGQGLAIEARAVVLLSGEPMPRASY
jgi:hypothetical protein